MDRIAISAFVACALLASHAVAQEPAGVPASVRMLTLDQALALAQESNAGLRAVRHRVEEAQRRNRVMFSNYLPRVKTQGGYLASDNTRGILLPAGSLGDVPGLGGFPLTDRSVSQGG